MLELGNVPHYFKYGIYVKMAFQTIYGCVNPLTGEITFAGNCLFPNAPCIVHGGIHDGQVKLELSDYWLNESCNDTFYGCVDSTGTFRVAIPDTCEVVGSACVDCGNAGLETPCVLSVTFSGIVLCTCAQWFFDSNRMNSNHNNVTYYVKQKETIPYTYCEWRDDKADIVTIDNYTNKWCDSWLSDFTKDLSVAVYHSGGTVIITAWCNAGGQGRIFYTNVGTPDPGYCAKGVYDNLLVGDQIFKINFDNGSHPPLASEIIYVDGFEGTQYAVVDDWTVNSGTWVGGDAVGQIRVTSPTNDFVSDIFNGSVLEDGGGTKICESTGGCSIHAGCGALVANRKTIGWGGTVTVEEIA